MAARDTWGIHVDQLGGSPPTRAMLYELTALAWIEREEQAKMLEALFSR